LHVESYCIMIKVAIFAGGNSGEHDISVKTGLNIEATLDKNQFIPYLIYVEGIDWIYRDSNGTRYKIDKDRFCLTTQTEVVFFDVVFNAIHGDPGENGKLQSYFEMMNIKYTGCDSFVSALTFNKYFCNSIVSQWGVPVAKSCHFYQVEEIDYDAVIEQCGLPCFVKPCNSGSSVGVNKAHDLDELKQFIELAFEVDHQIMVEQFIPGREMTCGVTLYQGEISALAVSEILSKKEFYDFEAKYTPGFLEVVTPAEINIELEKRIKEYSELIYKRLGCKGVVRIDYIITQDGIPYFLEINTIPGQTAVSLIPRQLKYNGIDLTYFYGSLILEALQS